jgi:hypothetical protein
MSLAVMLSHIIWNDNVNRTQAHTSTYEVITWDIVSIHVYMWVIAKKQGYIHNYSITDSPDMYGLTHKIL